MSNDENNDENNPNANAGAERPYGALVEIWSEGIAQVPSGFADSVMSAVTSADNTDALLGHAVVAWSESLTDGRSAQELAEQDAARVDALVAQSLYADRVEHSDTALTSALDIWATDGVAALPDGFAAQITHAAGIDSAELPAVQQVEPQLVDVVRPKRWLVPAAVSSVLAVAAVALFAFANTHARRPKPPVVNNSIAIIHPAPTDQRLLAPNIAQPLPAPRTQGAATRLIASIESSSVDKVNVDGERTQYTVTALPGEVEGTTVAVVWIEDGAKRQM